ncbi:MAG: hypothetical protein FWC57_02675 [Endomicrobia bacterium]|nr:hypothetical protein [Endomicrobiia bacterium]
MKKIALSLFMLFSINAICFAEIKMLSPNEIRYTGRVKSYQTPMNGKVNMTFRFYYEATGGTPIQSATIGP